jgi:uncharacterized protein YbaR (Trm112 family)
MNQLTKGGKIIMAIAKIELICKMCGKQFEYRKTCHNRKEANDTESWAENNVTFCPECRKKLYVEEQKEQEQKDYDKYAPSLESYHLPKLTGSESQIAWANRIRVIVLGKTLETVYTKSHFWDIISSFTEASWWINNRKEMNDVGSFVELLSREEKKKKAREKIAALEKPHIPEILVGHFWNSKIYGRNGGNFSIYLDNQRVSITYKQAVELEFYLIEKEKYKKKVEKLENGEEL